MGKVKILVVEDEAFVAVDMCSMLEELGYETCETAINYSEALQRMESEQPDLILCDINLNGSKDGIDIAEEVKKQHQIPIIFSTSYSDQNTVQRAVASRPSGYLVKPFKKEDLYTTIETALASFSGNQSTQNNGFRIKDSFFIKADKAFVKVRFDEILWLQSDRNYVEIYTEGKRYVARMSFRELLQSLPAEKFFQTHKSYYVNLEKLTSVKSGSVMIDEREIPLSRNFKGLLLEQLNKIV